MNRLFPLVLLAGCLDGSTYDVDVTWTSQGQTSIPAEEIGARIYFSGTDHGLGTSIWTPGSASSARIAVQSGTDTSEICVQLQRKTLEPVEQAGHTVLEEVYTDLSDRQCQDVLVDTDDPHAEFALVLAP
jgi:hypothetical protein